MTHAVLMVLIFFAILFVFHSIFLVVLWCSNSGAHSKPKQDSLLNLNEKRDNEEYLIVYASQSGQTENYARQTVQQLSSLGHTAQAISVEYFDTAVFSKSLKIFSVHDKFHRTLILSGFCLLKIAKISLNSSFFPKPIKR